jgi:hypothetical protein
MWMNINKTQSILGNKICADMMGNGCFTFCNFSVTLRANVTKLSLGYGDGAVGTLGDGLKLRQLQTCHMYLTRLLEDVHRSSFLS